MVSLLSRWHIKEWCVLDLMKYGDGWSLPPGCILPILTLLQDAPPLRRLQIVHSLVCFHLSVNCGTLCQSSSLLRSYWKLESKECITFFFFFGKSTCIMIHGSVFNKYSLNGANSTFEMTLKPKALVVFHWFWSKLGQGLGLPGNGFLVFLHGFPCAIVSCWKYRCLPPGAFPRL